MAEKKEIFDYLRNQQKSAEIESKVNGINLWVLIGAIAFIAWQIIGTAKEDLWSNPEMALRTLLFTEALYVFFSLGLIVNRAQHEVRYVQLKLNELESPFLVLFSGISLLLPPAFALVLIEKSLGTVILAILGIAAVGLSVIVVLIRIFGKETMTEKFPKPEFEPTLRERTISSLVSGTVLIIPIAEQAFFVWTHRLSLDSPLIKQLSLLSALYLLVMLLMDSKYLSNKLAWTYSLETELLIGTVTPEVALRRIEHRQLGPRLQDVMDNFFDDMDRKFATLDFLFDQCVSKLGPIKEIPLQYNTERASRIKEVTQPILDQIHQLTVDCKEFGAYFKKLNEKNVSPSKALLSSHLSNLKLRYEEYLKRVNDATNEIKAIFNEISLNEMGNEPNDINAHHQPK